MTQNLYQIIDYVDDGEIIYTVSAESKDKAKKIILKYMVETLGGERRLHRQRLSKPIFVAIDNSFYDIVSCSCK